MKTRIKKKKAGSKARGLVPAVTTIRACRLFSNTKELILHFGIKIKDLLEQGKGYEWPRPGRCPECKGGKLWGHGYVERYFDEFKDPLWVKRYRCAECGAVHTLRPKEYWRRFRARIRGIVLSLKEKIVRNRWFWGWSRQRQQYWWRGLKKQWMRAGEKRDAVEVKRLDRFMASGVIAATHSMKYFKRESFKHLGGRIFFFSPPS